MTDELIKLPEGWKWTKLGNMIELKYGKSLTKALRDGGNYNVYGSNGIVGSHSSHIVNKPCLIIGRKGSIGEVHFSQLPCWPIDTTYYIDEFYSQPINFWLYRLKALNLEKLDRASAVPGLNREDAYSLFIPLPPLNEQKRIVAKIEALQERSQRVKAELVAIRPLLDNFRQSVLAAAFRGDLTKDWRDDFGFDTKDWKQLTLKDILSEPLANGRSVPDAYEGFPVLRLTCIKNRRIDISERKIGAWDEEEAKKFAVFKGDFLVARGNGSLSLVGRGGLLDCIPDKIAFPDTIIRVRVKQNIIIPQYFSLVWDSHIIRKQIEFSARTTAGIHKINQKIMEGLILPVCSTQEQKEIVNRIDKLFKIADNIEREYQQTETDLETLNQSILAKAFRGELVPQNPNDEPASVLLERIRKERETHSKPAKQTRKKPPKTDNNKSTQLTLEDIE